MVLAALVVGGAVVRLLVMGEPMRIDEAFTYLNYVREPLDQITTTYNYPNNHILYSAAVHFAWGLFGDHLWTVRLPALLAGVALIPAAYVGARALYSRGAALWAAALVAGFSPLVDYSVNGRGYTMGILLMLIGLRIAVALLDRPRLGLWAAFTVCSSLAFYTVPSLACAVATVAVWMAAVAVVRRDLGLLLGLAVSLVVAAGLDLALYSGVLGQPGWTEWVRLGHGVEPALRLLERVWGSWNPSVPHPLDWMVAAGFLASLVLHRRLARHPVPLAVPAVAVFAAVILIGPAPWLQRTWLFALPLYLIQSGAGLSAAAERLAAHLRAPALASAAAAVLVALALGASVVLHGGELRSDQRPRSDNHIAGFLRGALAPGEPAVLDRDRLSVPAAYYFSVDHYAPPQLPRRHAALSALVLVPRDSGPPRVRFVVEQSGWRLQPRAAPPRLVKRFEYIEAWRARIE